MAQNSQTDIIPFSLIADENYEKYSIFLKAEEKDGQCGYFQPAR